ncbi:hypothetical protein JOB18_042524 [Solea senegalensis]|nr:hypothetical protein JOB18_042524 [Solea senegalensis]
MVSRLPKFGGRSSSSGANPLSNGSTQATTPPQDDKTIPPGSQPNGGICASPLSFKWKRDGGLTLSSPTSPAQRDEEKSQMQLPLLEKEVKNRSPGVPKTRRSGTLMVAVSSPKAIPKQSSTMSPKVGTKLGQSPLNRAPKFAHTGSNIPARTGSESRLVRPKLGSGAARSSSQDSLSQSSDSLKSLTTDNMVRSNSFTHFKQIPSPTTQTMTRSFSFNRAVELAKPLANTQLRPPCSSFLKPPQLSNGRVGLGLRCRNGNLGGSEGLDSGHGVLQYSRNQSASSRTTSSIPQAPITPSALKKPLFPSCVLTKSVGNNMGPLDFRLARSAQAIQQKPLFSGRIKGEIKSPECGELLDFETNGEAKTTDSPSDSDASSGDGGAIVGGSDAFRQSMSQAAGETIEDMSLSSASSIDRGETSEELLDDFDSMRDALSDGDVPDNRKVGATTQTRLHSPLNETIEWDTTDLKGHEEKSPMQDSQGPLLFSPEHGDIPHSSSVELSPSNSSGGTYMWDEEPFVSHGSHPLDSFDDSELNSMDILNNLEPLATRELDDDDLMLDVDLPEDGLHDMDRMSHIERSERAGRQGQQHKHHRWRGSGHFNNDSRAHVFQNYDRLKSSRIPARPPPSEGKHHGNMAMLDELTLEHMTQDCSLLKNQLLKLKTLLQLEDANSKAEAPEENEDNTSATQLGELIKEVQVLREELKNRDKTIAQLTLQCQQLQQQHQREQMPAEGHQVKCQCHHQRAPSLQQQSYRQMDERMQHHYDKATQTYWRPLSHAPQVLQPYSPCPSEHLHQGRIIKIPPTEGHSDVTRTRSEERTCANADHPLEGLISDMTAPAYTTKRSNRLSYHSHFPGSRAPQEVTARDSPAPVAWSAAQHEGREPAVMLQNSVSPRSAGSSCPRLLQPPRLHKHVSLPALKPGFTGNFASPKLGSSSGPFPNHTKQLPPPFRGLPCFNSGPQVQPPSLRRTSLLQPHRASDPCKDPRCKDSKTLGQTSS